MATNKDVMNKLNSLEKKFNKQLMRMSYEHDIIYYLIYIGLGIVMFNVSNNIFSSIWFGFLAIYGLYKFAKVIKKIKEVL